MKRYWVVAVLILLGVASREPLTFTLLDGSVVGFAHGVSEPSLVLHFWATWCPTCEIEMRELDAEVAACVPGRVRVVAVNVDEDVDTVRDYWARHDLKLKVVRDPGGDEWRRLGGKGLPFNWIVRGNVSRGLSGPRDRLAWRRLLADLGCESRE